MKTSQNKVPYVHNEVAHNMRAARVIVPILLQIKPAKSLLDVGCGTGTWLKAGEENGIHDYLGIDGTYVNPDNLLIEKEKFLAKDLTVTFNLNRKFDFVFCLEVAEHLPLTAADNLVDSLTNSGDFIVFSAAMPGQGGQNHLNEQWPQFWRQKFNERGYEFYDVVRPQIWNNSNVEIWYRQNLFIVTNNKSWIKQQSGLVDIVHPEVYEARINDYNHILQGRAGLRLSFIILLRALKLFFKR